MTQSRRGRMTKSILDDTQLNELLLEALETEIGGVEIYETAVACAVNEELQEEWEKYLDETRNHERILRNVFNEMGLDPDEESTGRGIVRANRKALIQAMTMAQQSGDASLAQLVAAECVVLAETKDHQNWQLIGEVTKHYDGDGATVLKEAYDEVEDQEDEHLYHTRGWARELWYDSLGIKAQLPPPEEMRKVTSAIGAARAAKSRKTSRNGRRSAVRPTAGRGRKAVNR